VPKEISSPADMINQIERNSSINKQAAGFEDPERMQFERREINSELDTFEQKM